MVPYLRTLLLLPLRPRHALSALLDAGGVFPALLLAALASVVLSTGLMGGVLAASWRAPGMATRAPRPALAAPARPARAPEGDDDAPLPAPPPPSARTLLAVSGGVLGPLTTVAALVFLYAPATLLLVTLFDRVGSFGVALRRDFGGLLVCTLSAFTAAYLPVGVGGALLALLGARPQASLGLVVLGTLAFAALMVLSVQTACGAGLGPALAAVGLSWLSFALQGLLPLLASPWLLYWGWGALSGQAGDVLGGLSARRSFRRYLEAATLNPRDADAHYQLGLLHLQRRQLPEAAERFRRAVEIDPGEIDAHFQLARLARVQGRAEEALQHLEEVLQRDSRHASWEAWREAGAVYLDRRSFEHARTVLSRFVEHRAWDAEGLYRLGLAHRGLAEEDAARDCFTRCVEAARTAPAHRQREVRPWRRLAEKALAAPGPTPR